MGLTPQARAKRTGREFAQLPREIIESDLDDPCVRLFALCDAEQGKNGRPAAGYRAIADALGWKADKVAKHAEHLRKRGLVAIEREGNQKAVVRVIYNRARGRSPSLAVLGAPRSRSRSKSSYTTNAGASDSEQSANTPQTGAGTPDDRVLEEGHWVPENGPQSRSLRYEEVFTPDLCEVTEDGEIVATAPPYCPTHGHDYSPKPYFTEGDCYCPC